jgi:hypothetical protein
MSEVYKRVINSLAEWTEVTSIVIKRYKVKPEPFEVTLQEPKAAKTLPQIRYIHAAVLKGLARALDDTGEMRFSEEGAKLWLKQFCQFGQYYKLKGTNEAVFVPRSFKDASKEEMIRLIDTAIQEAAERGTVIESYDINTFIFKEDRNVA